MTIASPDVSKVTFELRTRYDRNTTFPNYLQVVERTLLQILETNTPPTNDELEIRFKAVDEAKKFAEQAKNLGLKSRNNQVEADSETPAEDGIPSALYIDKKDFELRWEVFRFLKAVTNITYNRNLREDFNGNNQLAPEEVKLLIENDGVILTFLYKHFIENSTDTNWNEGYTQAKNFLSQQLDSIRTYSDNQKNDPLPKISSQAWRKNFEKQILGELELMARLHGFFSQDKKLEHFAIEVAKPEQDRTEGTDLIVGICKKDPKTGQEVYFQLRVQGKKFFLSHSYEGRNRRMASAKGERVTTHVELPAALPDQSLIIYSPDSDAVSDIIDLTTMKQVQLPVPTLRDSDTPEERKAAKKEAKKLFLNQLIQFIRSTGEIGSWLRLCRAVSKDKDIIQDQESGKEVTNNHLQNPLFKDKVINHHLACWAMLAET